jgi:hypothetical protein
MMMYKIFWRLKARFDSFVYDERSASRVRLFFILSLSLSIVLLGFNLFEDIDTTSWAEMWQNRYPYFFGIPLLFLRFFNFVVYGFRHMIIPIAVFIGMLLASAFYVQDVYELPNVKLGLKYMLAAFFGIGYPRLTIAGGKKQIPKGEISLIDTIGGPGYVNIRPGNVVLFESLRTPSNVRANSVNFISRFVTIKEIVSLEDQHGFIEQASVRTKDGIDLVVRDIHYRYRLRTGRRFGDYERRKAVDPYPYSIEAVKDMAYNRTVGKDGISSWHSAVRSAVDGGITDYIKSHKFDDLTAPNYDVSDPRSEIAKNMYQGIRLRLRSVGAELLWFDLGHFAISDQMKTAIANQRVETWSARWDGEAMVVQSYGEARRLAYQDMGRAEGQADLLLAIIQALDEAGFEGGYGEENKSERLKNLRSIIWMRIAQILDATAEEMRDDQSGKKLSSGSSYDSQ